MPQSPTRCPSLRRFVCLLALAALAASPCIVTPPAAAQSNDVAHLRSHEDKAVQILLDASRSDKAELRMHAVESSKSMPDRALPIVQLALDDANPAVRFAALVTVGRLEMESLGKRALEVSQDAAQPPYVQAAAIYAAHACGEPADLGQLAAMLWDPSIRVRSNVAMLLGLCGEPSAIPMLREAAREPMERERAVSRDLLRLQIAEAIVLLGSDEDIKALRGAAYASDYEVRITAVQILGRLGDQGMRGNFITFLAKDPVELRVAASEALARLDSLEGAPVMLQAAQHEQWTVRSQAAFALGQAAQDPRCAMALQRLLDDPNEMVRVAAAAAALGHLNKR